MAYNEYLADRIRFLLGKNVNMEEKKMFGGLFFLYQGKMTIGVAGDQILARVVSDKMEEELEKDGVDIMIHGGKEIKEFVVVDEEAYDLDEDLQHYIDLGIEHAKKKLAE